MEKQLVPAVPAVRVGRRLHLAASFPIPRRGPACSSTPALMADVRVVVRRHFPAGPGSRQTVQKVVADVALRRQSSRKLRCPDRVEQALAADVLPLVKHRFDRGAVVAAGKEICAYVSAACADRRLAEGGVQVLVLVDTFACPTLLRPMPRRIQPAKQAVVMRSNPCMRMEPRSAGVPAKTKVGVIGDGRPSSVDERMKGWLPW